MNASVDGVDHENGIDRTARVILQNPNELTRHALRRARHAVRCLPFQRAFYRYLEDGSLSSGELVALPDWSHQTRRQLNARQTEDLLIWLIQLGVLRREVDGQGLTERVRLTPLGREVLIDWPDVIPSAGPGSRLMHWCRRHRPRW